MGKKMLFTVATAIGSVAFALSGLIAGIRKELDIIGLFIVAMLTANGGGAIRDVLVNKTPHVLVDISAFYLVCATMAAAYVLKLHKDQAFEFRTWFVVSDSVGLAAFSMTGALVGLEAELNFFGVIVLSFLTATGGGIIRDTLTNELPSVLATGFYGAVSVIMASVIYVVNYAGFFNDVYLTMILIGGLSLRLCAYFFHWSLPRVRKSD